MLAIYRLPNKLKGEEVIKVVRKDFIILIQKILFFGVLIILPYLFFLMITSIFPSLMSGAISYPAIVLGISAYYLFVWLFFFFSFIQYYLDIWVITNQRIIYVRQDGFFARDISEQRLDKVQDATSEIHGVMSTVFNYGTVQVQTAAELERFSFDQVPKPEKIRDLIIKQVEISKNNSTTEE